MQASTEHCPMLLSFCGKIAPSIWSEILKSLEGNTLLDVNSVNYGVQSVIEAAVSFTSTTKEEQIASLNSFCRTNSIQFASGPLPGHAADDLTPLPKFRVILSSFDATKISHLLSDVLSKLQSFASVKEINVTPNLLWIDVSSRSQSTESLKALLSENVDHAKVAVIRGGLFLRRAKLFAFVDFEPATFANELLTVNEMRSVGSSLISIGASLTGVSSELDITCAENRPDCEQEFKRLMHERGLAPRDVVIVSAKVDSKIPPWLKSTLPRVGLATQSELVQIHSLKELLHLFTSECFKKSRTPEAAGGVFDASQLVSQLPAQVLANPGASLHVTCMHRSCVWITCPTKLPFASDSDFVVTVVSTADAASLCSESLKIISSSNAADVMESRMLSTAAFSPAPPTSDAAELLPMNCFEFAIRFEQQLSENDLLALRQKLKVLSDNFHGNVIMQRNDVSRLYRRLAVFDMDSTLVQQECIDEMAAAAGVGDEVKKITLRAMNGELDFEAALRARVSLLIGLHAEDLFANIRKKLIYTPGAAFMAAVLRHLGVTLAVLSGGFTSIVTAVRDHLGLHHAHANDLDVVDSKLTGSLVLGSPIIDAKAKLAHLRRLAFEKGIPLEQTIAVGDGANDLLMIEAAGLGVAFNAKPHVQKQAIYHVNHIDMTPLLLYMGISRSDAVQFLREEHEQQT